MRAHTTILMPQELPAGEVTYESRELIKIVRLTRGRILFIVAVK